MSSKQKCRHTGKAVFATYDKAHAALQVIIGRPHRNNRGCPTRVYPCSMCQGYHLTSARLGNVVIRPADLKHADKFAKYLGNDRETP